MGAQEQVLERIRELSRARGYSINLLADFAGVSRGHMSRILRGEKSPTLKTLGRIAEGLDVPLRDLFDPPGEAPRG